MDSLLFKIPENEDLLKFMGKIWCSSFLLNYLKNIVLSVLFQRTIVDINPDDDDADDVHRELLSAVDPQTDEDEALYE